MHGRLPIGDEVPTIRETGIAFTKTLADDRRPLSKAARKRIAALGILANEQEARMDGRG